jgi:hypothetical protein
VPEFPVDVFPTWLRDFIEAESTATQTPKDLAAMLVLAVVAIASAGKVRVRIKDGHEEPLNLWTVIVLPPAARKSPVFRDVTEPVETFEAEAAEKIRESIAEALQLRRVLESRLKRAEDRAGKGDAPKRGELLAEAQRIRRELDSLAVPIQPRLVVDECTPERLASLLREHDGRMAVLSAEGDIFDFMSGRYTASGAPNLGVFLRGHAGDPLRVDRVGRAAEFVRCPALTLGLAIQPEVLEGLMARPGFRGRGLLARFLYAVPKSTLGRRDVEAPPVPLEDRSNYMSGVRALLNLPWGTDTEGRPSAHSLTLNAEAREALLEFERDLEPRLGELGDLGHLSDWAGKLAGAVARVAGLLHIADLVNDFPPWAVPVGHGCVRRAARVGGYLIEHAQAAFAQMGADPDMENARYLVRGIERVGRPTFSKRDAFESTRGRFKRVSELEPALALLEDRNYIRRRPDDPHPGSGRKPSPTFEVNPIPFSQNPQNRGAAGDSVDCEDFGDHPTADGAGR